MLKVYLLRHGETAYNADGNRYCGRTDIGLTDKGKNQAQKVYQYLKDVHINAVYSSPLTRARLTAAIATGWQNVQPDERIIEVDFGNWEGKTKDEFYAEDPVSWDKWISNPETARAGRTGETGLQVVARVDAFYKDMLNRHAGQTIVVVGHNGINRLYMAHKLEMPLRNYQRIFQENSAVTLFELYDDGNIILKKLNA